MNVLYLTRYANALSESAARTEMEWMERNGVRISVWSRGGAIPTYRCDRSAALFGGDVGPAVERFKPEIVHALDVSLACDVLPAAMERGLPVTVRHLGSSVNPEELFYLEHASTIRAIWLTPPVVESSMSRKVRPLPACFDPQRYGPAEQVFPPTVFRAVDDGKGKGLETFFAIAAECPKTRFLLATIRSPRNEQALDPILPTAPPNVEVKVNLTHEAVASEMKSASVYLHGLDPAKKSYGMPPTIAEAMASGLWVLVPAGSSDEYPGKAGRTYAGASEAAALIRQAVSWKQEEWRQVRDAAVEGARPYAADRVLRDILDTWASLRVSRS